MVFARWFFEKVGRTQIFGIVIRSHSCVTLLFTAAWKMLEVGSAHAQETVPGGSKCFLLRDSFVVRGS